MDGFIIEHPPAERKDFGDILGGLNGAVPSFTAKTPGTSAAGPDVFRQFWDLGYRRLVPVIPPNAAISKRSSITKRLASGRDDRGKVPGERWADGAWSGMPWVMHEATETDLSKWASWGAGVGVKAGDLGDGTSLVMIDADTLDVERAKAIKGAVEKTIGKLPVRVGRYPKAGYLVRVRGGLRYARVEFGAEDEKRERVEILSDGKLFVAAGVHPTTKQPYRWPAGDPPAIADVPVVEPEALLRLLDTLKLLLPNCGEVKKEGATGSVDQAALRGEPEKVKAAVEATRNRTKDFPSRDEWVAYGYLIKAAMGPGHEAEALELFLDWSDRWEDPYEDEHGVKASNPHDYAQAEWAPMQPPFKAGASKLFDIACRRSDGAFTMGDVWFEEPAPQIDPLFPEAPKVDPFAHVAVVCGPMDPKSIPLREWVVEPRYPRGAAVELAGEPGINKSTLMLHDALTIATGAERLLTGGHSTPERLHVPGPVLVYNAEDSRDEMARRLIAAKAFHGLAGVEHHPIHLWSGLDQHLTVVHRTAANGGVTRTPALGELESFIRRQGIVAVFLDPQVSLGRGLTENSTEDMNDLLQELHALAARCNCAVAVVHHTAKNSRNLAGDMAAGRGAFSAAGKVRGFFTAVRVTPEDAEAWGFGEAKGLIRIDYAKVSHGERPEIPLVLRVRSVPVGNGEGFSTAAEAFEGSPAELHRMLGDQAPVLEVVGMGRAAASPKAASPSAASRERRKSVADAVAKVMCERAEVRLSDIRPEITQALNEAGVTISQDRALITDIVQSTLSGEGVQIMRDGQTVRVLALKVGVGRTAPWVVRLSDNLSERSLENLEKLENGGLFS